jgi:hypothetical protein
LKNLVKIEEYGFIEQATIGSLLLATHTMCRVEEFKVASAGFVREIFGKTLASFMKHQKCFPVHGNKCTSITH